MTAFSRINSVLSPYDWDDKQSGGRINGDPSRETLSLDWLTIQGNLSPWLEEDFAIKCPLVQSLQPSICFLSVRSVNWIDDSKERLRDFPDPVQHTVGYALFRAQEGKKHPDAKPLKGFMGAGVLEMVDDHDGDTYRAVYTVKLEGVVYVLHAFQRKSKRGIATPKREIDLIKSRMQLAQRVHEERNIP